MSCEYVHERLSPLLDERVTPEERGTVLAHLDACRDCSAHLELLESQRSELLQMAAPPMPANLYQKLQVVASHERARTLSRLTFQARVNHFTTRLHLMFDNIARPFGLPAASGLLSAMALFALLAPSLSMARAGGDDGPTGVATYPQLEEVGDVGAYPQVEDPDSFGSSYEKVIELKITPTGSVWDWNVVKGDKELTPDLKQMILIARFKPATIFGQPTWGVVRLLYKHAYIIKG